VPEDFGDRLDAYEAILRRLTAMLHTQQGMYQRLEAAIEALRAFNQQQVAINADVNTTRARIETLLACRICGADNGREA
jgi:hypothetical protein